ncbi:MAG TPA: hypothetical protein ENH94_00335 [Phycisphaerales bacterium]|nr:hypothetical protein [Phycisphaerales bacterium]
MDTEPPTHCVLGKGAGRPINCDSINAEYLGLVEPLSACELAWQRREVDINPKWRPPTIDNLMERYKTEFFKGWQASAAKEVESQALKKFGEHVRI